MTHTLANVSGSNLLIVTYLQLDYEKELIVDLE